MSIKLILQCLAMEHSQSQYFQEQNRHQPRSSQEQYMQDVKKWYKKIKLRDGKRLEIEIERLEIGERNCEGFLHNLWITNRII